ncbi:remorin-like [Argentina anserina]|uniref:remorin-like n=1 Tax=Argentina anserina TaxID=57926 RepID=UPI002176336B|nr:remorin-like [Potentilla anserina]
MAQAPSAPPMGVSHAAPAKPQKDSGVAKVLSTNTAGLIKAWEDSEKAKLENKANKRISNVGTWERSKQASIEAQQRKYEEKLEKKKALYFEKMQNKIAELHKEAEEKRMLVEVARKEECQKVVEMAEKYRATGHAPKNKILPCFHP